jgi:phosphatidylserine/phosphatidylglycerophosphate/cardiolipin synthase-like enzyme
MPALFSPVADPASWNYATVDGVTIPDGLRYAGYAVRGVRATRSAANAVQLPATGVLRRLPDTTGHVFVELQLIPFPIRHVANAFPGGLPTFYLVFDDATGLTFADGDADLGGTTLRNATSVTILAIRQDRLLLDPALWAAQFASAITQAGGDASQWQPFAAAVAAATATGDTAPVLLYDHSGAPRVAGNVELVLGADGTRLATLAPEDGGDLQRTVARMHAANPAAMPITNLWGGGRTSFLLRPLADAGDVQLVRLDDGAVAATELTLTRELRSAAFTNLAGWLSPQRAGLTAAPNLSRFFRGNRFTPLVNGPELFDDFFVRLRDAQRPDGGVHLATGWQMFPQAKLTRRALGDDPLATLTLDDVMPLLGPDNIPFTLEQAAKLIGDAGGASRFLNCKFIQFEDPRAPTVAELIAVSFVVEFVIILNAMGVAAARTDWVGGFVMFAAAVGISVYTQHVLDANGDPLEPNKPAIDILNAIGRTLSAFAPYPARVEDNTPTPSLTDFPFDAIFTVTRHVGLYHQKFAIIKVGADHFGYCGGIDFNPNRLDDANHLARGPYHDVHARIEGNAVHDLALTFDQRWERDGGGQDPAFEVPGIDAALAPGGDIVQVARTYYAPAIGGEDRALHFAPNGDRTLFDTMRLAILHAQEFIYIEDQYFTPPPEYREALVGKVARREIRQLIVTIPGSTDQLFGDAVRQAFISDLMAADAGAGIVRIGYPRRRFTSTDNEIRASSGKLLLGGDLAAGGGELSLIFLAPAARIPALPFWVAVEGELIYVYDESSATIVQEGTKAFLCERGDSTAVINGGASPSGAFPRAHKQGAPATAVDLTDIYVHAKMMIVDDVFVSIGSANLNNRGLFYDGEANCFTIPEALRASPRNPALMLRRKLWAEMLDLPAEMLAPLLGDPLACGRLFERSPFAGNRYTRIDARPPHLLLGYTSGDGAIGDLFQALGFTILAANHSALFAQIIDPRSRTVTQT